MSWIVQRRSIHCLLLACSTLLLLVDGAGVTARGDDGVIAPDQERTATITFRGADLPAEDLESFVRNLGLCLETFRYQGPGGELEYEIVLETCRGNRPPKISSVSGTFDELGIERAGTLSVAATPDISTMPLLGATLCDEPLGFFHLVTESGSERTATIPFDLGDRRDYLWEASRGSRRVIKGPVTFEPGEKVVLVEYEHERIFSDSRQLRDGDLLEKVRFRFKAGIPAYSDDSREENEAGLDAY